MEIERISAHDWWIPACQSSQFEQNCHRWGISHRYVICVITAGGKITHEWNKSSSSATFIWIHLLGPCCCDDLTFRGGSINENAMFKVNEIFQLRGRAFICDRPPQPLLLALPYIQLNAPVTWAFSLDGTCRDVGTRLRTPASPRPKTDDQQR